MSEQPVEVVFCDLCEVSVSAAELASGVAVRHRGKVIGPCCLSQLRPTPPPAPVAAAAAPHGGEGRLLPVAVVLLAAIAAATIYLDQKVSGADTRWRQSQEQMLVAQQTQGQELNRVDMAMDGLARRTDLDALQSRITEVAAGLPRSDDANKHASALTKELGILQQEVRGVAGQMVDYRPLFEEQRGRQQRVLELLSSLREAAAAAPAAAPAPANPTPETPVEAAAPAGLPPAVAAQVGKLRSAEASVRFVAVDELFKLKSPDVLVHLLPMAKDDDPFVRRLTIDGLRDYKQAAVVDVLLLALGDADENVRDTAWGSLKLVTGQKLPFEATAAKDPRARAVQRWQEWWDKNKATFGG